MNPEDNIHHLKLADTDDLTVLQIYLIDAFEDLQNLGTLCKALKKTTLDIEDMIDNELDELKYR